MYVQPHIAWLTMAAVYIVCSVVVIDDDRPNYLVFIKWPESECTWNIRNENSLSTFFSFFFLSSSVVCALSSCMLCNGAVVVLVHLFRLEFSWIFSDCGKHGNAWQMKMFKCVLWSINFSRYIVVVAIRFLFSIRFQFSTKRNQNC